MENMGQVLRKDEVKQIFYQSRKHVWILDVKIILKLLSQWSKYGKLFIGLVLVFRFELYPLEFGPHD